jgi:hypothetical protein
MAKDHGDRFPTMAEFAAELEACRSDDGDEGATMIARPSPAVARPRGAGRRRSRWIWIFGVTGVGLAAIAGALIGALVLGGHGNGSGAAPRPSGPVRWASATAYDPEAGDGEHNAEAKYAVDGVPATYWTTETYQSFGKKGVGIIAVARRAVSPRLVTVRTDTPGFTAEIRVSDSPDGPFRTASSARTVGTQTAFALDRGGRYFLVWITDLGVGNDKAHVNEISAR